MLIRTGSAPASLAEPVRAQVMATDPDQPVFNVRPMDEVVSASIAGRRFSMLLFTIFAAVALLLAAVGIFGVMSYAVERRTREFGIRMALGAGASDVVGRVVRRGLAIGAAGSAIGLAGVAALSRFLSALLFHVSALDWISYSTAALALIAVAGAASYVPVRRAVLQDPMKSLRAD